MSDDSKCLMNVTNGKLDGNKNTLQFLVSFKFTKKKKKKQNLRYFGSSCYSYSHL